MVGNDKTQRSRGFDARSRCRPHNLKALSRKHVARIVVVNVLVAGALLAGLEFTARVLTYFGIVQSWKPIRVVWIEGTNDYRLAHLTLDDRREPDPVLHWRPVPGPPYNAQRFKGPLMAVPKPAGVFRIVCYGDSNTDGPDEGAWPGELQHILDERADRGRPRYEVVNAGVVGYSSHQGLLRFRQEVKLYQPDLIIVSFGWNDTAVVARGASDGSYQQPSAWRIRVLRVLLKSRLFLVLMRYLPKVTADQPRGDTVRVPMSEYVHNMEAFAAAAHKHGASVVFLTRPHREQPTNVHLLGQVPAYNSQLRLWTQQHGLPVIDVQAIFENAGAEFFADQSHLTVRGHRRMAETLSTELTRRGLIREVTP